MEIDSISELVDCVRVAGAMARDEQRGPFPIHGSYKEDGSVVTDIDARLEDYLLRETSRRYPDANIMSEETMHSIDPTRPYTFVIDPIDGTDVFTQGMAGWCVSVGLLDRQLHPIAGIVFSPTLDLMIFADIGKKAKCNGHEVITLNAVEPLSSKSNIMVSSRIHKQIDLARYPGKIRCIGGAALHLCFPLIYPGIAGAIHYSRTYIWDIAGAHAINLSLGWDFEYLEGGGMDYQDLINCHPITDAILCGPDQVIDTLKAILVKKR